MMTILMKGGNEGTGIPRFDGLPSTASRSGSVLGSIVNKNKDMPGKFIDGFPSIKE